MNALAQIDRLWKNLAALGAKKLAALGLVGLSVFLMVGLSGYYLSRPSEVPLYTGLDRDDVVSIGAALREAGIVFDVNADGNTVMVPASQAALARMKLAEKGLPRSGSEGYELFDKLGSLGLTSFMQKITKVRALEGELARTIQMMQGVRAARVQIVLADNGTYERESEKPSASVVIRTNDSDDRSLALAIRHLVAASLPGMKPEEVTVLDTNGLLLASGSDSIDQEPINMLALEEKVSRGIQSSIRTTLAPYLTLHNFQVSVATQLDTDKVLTDQTTYDPDSRVERSVRTIQDTSNSQDASAQPPVTASSNLPQSSSASQNSSKQSTDDSQKRDQLTNYEISSKRVKSESSGYQIKRLSVALLVNRQALAASLGKNPTPAAIQHQIDDLTQLVSTAAGLDKARGDTIKVSVVDFADGDRELQPVPGPSIMEIVAQQSGSLVSSGAIVLVAGMLILFGLRPATRALLAVPLTAGSSVPLLSTNAPIAIAGAPIGALADAAASSNLLVEPNDAGDRLLEDLAQRKENSPYRRLEQLIDYDEEQAAAILRQWIKKGASA